MTEMARIVSSHRLGQASGAVWLFGYAGMLAGGLLAAAAAPRLGWMPTLLLAWAAGARCWSPAGSSRGGRAARRWLSSSAVPGAAGTPNRRACAPAISARQG